MNDFKNIILKYNSTSIYRCILITRLLNSKEKSTDGDADYGIYLVEIHFFCMITIANQSKEMWKSWG